MFFRLLALSSILVLASCAYAVETQMQDIRVETPGAENALCFMYVEQLKYKVRPPQTMRVSKSMQDLLVDCMAPGNRHKKVVIKAVLSRKAIAEAPLIVPLIWDVASSSAYKYPDVVSVDFTYTPVRPESLPAQNRPDVKQPEEYLLEEYMPGRPRLNSDKYSTPPEFKRREAPSYAPQAASPYLIEETVTTSDKGSLKKTAPKTSASSSAPKAADVNPSGPPSLMTAPGDDEPGPSYPGQ